MDDDDKVVKMTLIAGKMPEKLGTTLENITDLVGKTIIGVAVSSVPSNYGQEPCSVLLFTDGTFHGFVHPRDE